MVAHHNAISLAKAREECEKHVLDTYRETASQHEREMLRSIQQAKSTGPSLSYKTQSHIGHPRGDNVAYERLFGDGFCIIGDPDTVTQKVKEPQEAIKTIELFAKEVMPNLR